MQISKISFVTILGIYLALYIGCSDQGEIMEMQKTPKPILQCYTTMTQSFLMQTDSIEMKAGDDKLQTLTVDTSIIFQSVDGFGFTLTGGSAYLINKMSKNEGDALLNSLFKCDDKGACISYLRISLGASDLNSFVFSYDDLPNGEQDFDLSKFSLKEDLIDLIPVIKRIQLINPSIKLMASPWSAPAWMKTNRSTKGGNLSLDCYDVYARYFVKYIQEMKNNGIDITSVTIQNEPQNPNNNPSMVMSSTQQANFIKNNLGPAFKANGITTKIIVWDHNCDDYQFPISVLQDNDANPYIDGSAFHLYGGEIGAMSLVHNAFPTKNLYFTEQWTSGNGVFETDLSWHTRNVVMGSSRNWAKAIMEWNLANDPSYQPHTPGGCTLCKGAITIDGNTYQKNVSYYIIGQASTYVHPDSKRIFSTYFESYPNVAWQRADGKKVMLVLNESANAQSINIKQGEHFFKIELKPKSVNTIMW